MTNFDLKIETITEGDMKPVLPQPCPVAIASTAVGEDQQAVGIGIISRSGFWPPRAYGIYGELRGVTSGTNTDKALI